MSWQGIEGHDAVVEQFRRALARGRLASTFLFVGPPGVGKRSFALKLAQSLLCTARPTEALDPCGMCPACVQVLAGTHPDLHLVARPNDKSFIPVGLLIGDEGQRMREGLCREIAMKPMMGGRRVAIIDDADFLNEEGANCLLKTLEEPPPQSVLILIGTSPEKQLPTIRSRSQVIRFRGLPADALAKLLVEQGVTANSADALLIAEVSEGSMERALEVADPELWKFRQQLLTALSKAQWDSVGLAKAVCAFVDEAGKDANPRRTRSRQLIAFAAQFYRQLLRALSGAPSEGDAPLRLAVDEAQRAGQRNVEVAAARLDRCLEALGHVDRNANQSTLLESWIDDLTRFGAESHVLAAHAR